MEIIDSIVVRRSRGSACPALILQILGDLTARAIRPRTVGGR
jgi:hypothetical protein